MPFIFCLPYLFTANSIKQVQLPVPVFKKLFVNIDFFILIFFSSYSQCEDSECSTPSGRLQKQSSSESFVFVNKDGLAVVKMPQKLRQGFRWQRQLVFRSKLTLHTSFERKDNPTPAAITCIAPSRYCTVSAYHFSQRRG